MIINTRYSQKELSLLDSTMVAINGHSLTSWITAALITALHRKPIVNPFVINWKLARSTNKYFENRPNREPFGISQIKITLLDDNPDMETQIEDTLYDHGINFWNAQAIIDYCLSQLIAGADNQFTIPINENNLSVDQARNFYDQGKLHLDI